MIDSMIMAVTFGEWISTWYHIIAMILIVIGIAMYILAKRLAIVIKKKDNLETNDKLVLTFRIIALVIFVVGIILFCLPPQEL